MSIQNLKNMSFQIYFSPPAKPFFKKNKKKKNIKKKKQQKIKIKFFFLYPVQLA